MAAPMRMPGEEKKRSPSRHSITIDKRESVNVLGVTDVISFDEESVIGETELGVIIIRGVNLHVNRISLDSGELSVSGEIDGIAYENPGKAGKSKSLMGRLFR
ncbi:MAG: sporulation protein YabP [Clostridiales bacterium]|jgi:sporulation protein YabP|nr:sporulation protein YabP [Clostridiales bacterium]